MQEIYGTEGSSRQRVDTAAIEVNLRCTSNVWEHFMESKFDQYKLTVVGMSTPVLLLVLDSVFRVISHPGRLQPRTSRQ